MAWAVAGRVSASEPSRWTDDSFEDFSKGTFDAAGQNIYVSRDGKIRSIHRFDLNQDGWLDLFFGNTHDEQSAVPPTLGTVSPDRSISQQALPVLGSDRVRVADLNRDGFPDLVFSLKNDGLQTSWRDISIIYGSEDGWTARRASGVLPAENPLDLAVTDFNGDGWPDIAVLGRPYALARVPVKGDLRIYWGNPTGFSFTRFEDFSIPGARHLATADFDGDGKEDLAISDGEATVHVLPGTKEGKDKKTTKFSLPKGTYLDLAAADVNGDGQKDLILTTDKNKAVLLPGKSGGKWGKPVEFDAFPASHASIADLDADGFPDLILSYLAAGTASMASSTAAGENVPDSIRILWGGREGFSPGRHLALPAKYASATAAGDIDGDGRMDLAVAIAQGETTYAADSLIYYGGPDRKFTLSSQSPKTDGASDTAVVPAQENRPGSVIFSNHVRGTLHEKVPVYVYWGGKEGFGTDHLWKIPGQSGHKGTGVDLNADGYVDLLVNFTAHGGEMALLNPIAGLNIFWGGPQGFDPEKARTILPTPWMDHCNVADLNRDGYLDVVLGGWDPWLGKEKGRPSEVLIFYGSAKGLDPLKPVSLPAKGYSSGVAIADYDKDGWLDIAATSYTSDLVRIFWGSAEGFDEKRQKKLQIDTPLGIDTADLNADGYLDLMVGHYIDEANNLLNAGMRILWGGPDGFREWDSQWLPGYTPVDFTVADYDGDGYLDIFCSNYHAQNQREQIPSYFYWGGPEGFNRQQRTSIICDSASGAFAGDFDQDGKIDLAISCHTKHGNHNIDSLVLYNDGKRFFQPRTEYLPTLGSHFMYVQDLGHIYDRKNRCEYQSSVFALPRPAKEGRLSFAAEIPAGTALQFAVRSAHEEKELSEKPWRKLEGSGFSLSEDDRFLQYQAILASEIGDRFPVLDKVEVTVGNESP